MDRPNRSPTVRKRIVNRIHADSIDLRSPADDAERRRVGRDYALEHVQLAYASTVHGIQGETVDTSIVGPDVDAAGLYVGLTRGRRQNFAIAIAGTAERATQVIATTMMRGTTELTLNDAKRGVEGELRRAARQAASAPQVFAIPDSGSRGIGR